MTIRTQLKAGGITRNHNEALQVRTSLKAGGWNNHNEALRRDSYPLAISMRRQPRTTGRKGRPARTTRGTRWPACWASGARPQSLLG